MPISVAIRREFVEGFVPLGLHVARNLIRAGLPLEEAFNCKADLYRLTSLYDGQVCPDRPPPGWRNEAWERTLEELRESLLRHEGDADSAAFEREGYEILRPILEAALERDVAKWPRIEDRPYGFFTYNVTDTWLPGRTVIGLHLGNPFAPASPFADMPARARELRRLVDDVTREKTGEKTGTVPPSLRGGTVPVFGGAEARGYSPPPAAGCSPRLDTIGTGSWLNSLAPFLTLFPPEWAASARPYPRLVIGKGWWGQFVDRRGGFHRKNADHLRRTGRFPYPVLDCHCSIESLRRHLADRFGIQ